MPRPSPVALTALGLAAALSLPFAPAQAALVPDPVISSAPGARLALAPLGSYDTGTFDESAAEIVEFYAGADRLLVVNAARATVEVLDAADPAHPTKLFDLGTTGVPSADGSVVPAGAVANSVAVREDGLGVVAVESDPKTDRGWLVFFDAAGDGEALGAVRVGAQPDMVTLTPDGRRAVVANEAEPAEDYTVDPEGSVGVVVLPRRVRAPGQRAVSLAGFHAFEGDRLPGGVRVFGGRQDAGTGTPDFPVSENLEPEYVAVDAASRLAWVTLQENNAVAVVDLRRAKIVDVWDLGTVDRTRVPFDASDRDGGVNLRTWPVRSYRLPDAIAAYTVRGRTFVITADEGDTRDWEGYSEEVRVKDLGEDGVPPLCRDLGPLSGDADLGRLKVTSAQGLAADGSCYETLYAFGGRGMSVFTADGHLVSSTGAQLERITAAALPEEFNSNHTEPAFDARSDDKGPEPEGVSLGRVAGRTYAFVGLERVGGVMVYDVTRPAHPRFVTYVDNRNFAYSGEDLAPEDLGLAGDLGPEGLAFISRRESPTHAP